MISAKEDKRDGEVNRDERPTARFNAVQRIRTLVAGDEQEEHQQVGNYSGGSYKSPLLALLHGFEPRAV